MIVQYHTETKKLRNTTLKSENVVIFQCYEYTTRFRI